MKSMICLILALSATACSSSFGPFITNVVPLKDGSIKVRRCMITTESYGMNVIDIDEGKCTQETIPVRD